MRLGGGGGGERRGGGVGRLIEGGGVPDFRSQLKDEFSVIFVILLRLNQQERLRGKERNPLSLLQSDSKMHVSVLKNKLQLLKPMKFEFQSPQIKS